VLTIVGNNTHPVWNLWKLLSWENCC